MKKSLLLLPIAALLLGGCVGKKHYAESDYVRFLPWDKAEDYKILQLGDIHQSQSDLHEEHFKVIERTIKATNPDLIVLDGDIFTFADKHVVKKVFNFIESFGIYWTYTFGNHDDQGLYSDVYIQRLLASNKYQHCRFVNLEDDDVDGRSNFVINVNDGNDTLYQVYCLDSQNYNFDTMGYDFIKQDQIDWYERMVKYSTAHYGGVVKSSMFIHIAFPEFVKDWETKTEDDFIIGMMEEGAGSPEEDLGFFNKIKELGSTQTVHANHDHANDSVLLYEGVYFSYGVHSTNRIYNDKETKKIGGQIVKVKKADRSKITFENYYASYESDEVKVISSGELGGAR